MTPWPNQVHNHNQIEPARLPIATRISTIYYRVLCSRTYSSAHDSFRREALRTVSVFAWENKMDQTQSSEDVDSGVMASFITELVTSPINLALLGLCAFLLYKIVKSRRQDASKTQQPELPPMKKKDFTLEQLKEFDGRGKDGRILIAVNGIVFDVTRGRRFYGPGT